MEEKVTLEKIAGYVNRMKLKKTVLFGFDRTDVYRQLMELDGLYRSYAREGDERIEELEARIEALKAQVDKEKETARQAALALRSARKLAEQSGASREQHQAMQAEIERLKGELEQAKANQGRSWEDIPVILREAEAERSRIIESARLEAQQEKLRVQAAHRQEVESLRAEKRRLLELIWVIEESVTGAKNSMDQLREKLKDVEPEPSESGKGSLLTIAREALS